MSYIEKIEKAREKSYSHSIAIRIRDLMKNLRLSSRENSPRRWIWELLQNAKDVSNESGKIKVIVDLNLDKKVLEFSHNGRPFTSENITFLIEQVSTKDQNNKEKNNLKETGKFGTGFLTTHLLSEIVTINGILKEPDEPHKQFNLTLDRTGKDIESIIQSVDRSLEQLKNVENTSNIDYSPGKFNTSFIYRLNEDGISVAKRGINDLRNSIAFTLIFLPEIEEVYIKNERIKYKVLENVIPIADNITLYTIIENKDLTRIEHNIIVSRQNDVSIAVQVEISENKIYLKEFSNLTPKLFCDFPLIGTDNFPFPIIINCPTFNCNEPRSGIWLTDENNEEVIENKNIMAIAVQLYNNLLTLASKNHWGNMYLFASKINMILDVDWLSNKLMQREIINPIKEKLLYTPIVDTFAGKRVAIKKDHDKFKVNFPKHKEQTVRYNIWDLCKYIIPEKLPVKGDLDNWNIVLWDECKRLSLKALTEFIQDKGDLESFGACLSNSCDAIYWLNTYYKLLNEEKVFIETLVGDKYSVIPNQNGIFKKRTELRIDDNIDEELKNVLVLLEEDCRDYLLHKSIRTGLEYDKMEAKSITSKINEALTDGSSTAVAVNEASLYLISLFSDEAEFPKERETIYQYCRTVFPDQVNQKKSIINWSKSIWGKADKIVIEKIVCEISSYKNIDGVSRKLDIYEYNETLEWIDDLISYLKKNEYDYLLNEDTTKILPNQNGLFCIKDHLFLDDDSIDEKLKDISASLGFDFRDELLSKDILLDLPQNRTKTLKDVADKISNLVRGKWNDLLKTEETKKSLRELLFWFNENEKKAKEFFADLYKSKHKLLDDAEIIESLDKASKYDALMNKFNINDHHKLEQILESASNNINADTNKQYLSDEILIQLGICSSEELRNAFNNRVFADNFVHISDRDVFKFDHVQTIINRAMNRVFEHLEARSEYDLTDKEEIARTIFSIKKNGEDIYIIVRPSDFNQIIIYYDSEKDLLDYEKDCELWIDDGRSTPRKITFGKILKITGINKIPLMRVV